MTRYLVKQFFLSLLKLFLFVTFMFFFIQIMIPGDFVDQFSLWMGPAERDAMREQLGLNLPITQRYIRWLGQIIHLDLGQSFYGHDIVEILKHAIPLTLLVFLTGTAIAFLIGLWLGKRTAWRGPGFLSGTATLGGITLFTSFPPWLAWLLAYVFVRGRDFTIMGEIGGLHAAAFTNLNDDVWRNVLTTPSKITSYIVTTLIVSTFAFLLINALLTRFTKLRIPTILMIILICAGTYGLWNYLGIQYLALDIVRVSWLASLTYTLLSFGETMIIMQSSMTDVLNEEYVKTAKAKGLHPSKVRERHAARNALLPVLSRLVISLPYLITGVVIVESSVGWPGMGTNLWNALYWQNMPVVMNTLLIVGAIALIARLFLDILIAYMDPRIRHAYIDPTQV